jgi:hypothetical protein
MPKKRNKEMIMIILIVIIMLAVLFLSGVFYFSFLAGSPVNAQVVFNAKTNSFIDNASQDAINSTSNSDIETNPTGK